jgi:hypothetical protein
MRTKNENVELTGTSRYYSVEYERENGDSISAVVTEMWDALSKSQNIEIASVEIDEIDIEMLKPLPQKVEQEIEEEIFNVFEENRR